MIEWIIGSVDKDQLSELLSRGGGRFKLPNVSREEFDHWRSDKEEIGGFECNSSLKSIIKADSGPLHEGTVLALAKWLRSLASEHRGFRVSLGEGNITSDGLHIIINMAAEFNFEVSEGNITNTKRPDCFVKSKQKSHPRMVIEVEYAETFKKLVEDAHRWLHGSSLVHIVFPCQD